jgi:type IV pilus assembly protein PilE
VYMPKKPMDMPKPRKSRAVAGFTLVELMVTISIAATLTAIAMPSYSSVIRKSRRVEARLALLQLAAREERFFSTNSAYTVSPTDLGYAGSFPQAIAGGYYQISICVAQDVPCNSGTGTTGSSFAAQAVPVGPQTSDSECTSLSLDSTGAQSATGTNANTCWTN